MISFLKVLGFTNKVLNLSLMIRNMLLNRKVQILVFLLLCVNIFFPYSGELSCGCGCYKNNMNERFLKELRKIENKMNKNFQINSGTRCEDYNKRQSGSSSTSQHLYGLAVDISDRGWYDYERQELVEYAESSGYFTKVLLYHDSNHIHIEKDYSKYSFEHRKIWKNKSSKSRNYYSSSNFYIGSVYNEDNKEFLRLGYHIPYNKWGDAFNVFSDILHPKICGVPNPSNAFYII